MAHKKAGGSTSLGRDSKSKRLGPKKFDGQIVKAGMVLVRQRGTHFRAGQNVKRGGDDTLFAVKPGAVKINQKRIKRFDGSTKIARIVNVNVKE